MFPKCPHESRRGTLHTRTRYVCTDNPSELAWFMGVDESSLVRGAKPADEDLLECSEVRPPMCRQVMA